MSVWQKCTSKQNLKTQSKRNKNTETNQLRSAYERCQLILTDKQSFHVVEQVPMGIFRTIDANQRF